MEFTDAETKFLIHCLKLSVDLFTENARLVRKDNNKGLEPLAGLFVDKATQATALIKRLEFLD